MEPYSRTLHNWYSRNRPQGPWNDQAWEQHRGKGPKNYKPSDDKIKEDVCDMLMINRDLDASDIEVAVAEGEVTLTGTVSHRREKRLAENLAYQAYGVHDVHNRLRVNYEIDDDRTDF